jgi:hypothetical protein
MAREKKCDKVYVGPETAEGEKNEKRSWFPEATRLDLRFASGDVVAVTLDGLSDAMKVAAAYHGLSQKLGDTYAGKSADDALEGVESLWERIQEGHWVAERESAGPRTSLLEEAIKAACAKVNQPVADNLSEMLKAMSNDDRKGLLADARVKAEYEAIRAARAAEKAAKAAASAAEAEGPIAIGAPATA